VRRALPAQPAEEERATTWCSWPSSGSPSRSTSSSDS
jgi:hypothetical protein